jgi:hypothetical protein
MWLSSAALVAAVAGAGCGPALHWLWNVRTHDSMYATQVERIEDGYVDRGPIARVAADAADGARPLHCHRAGAPRTDTFCSTSRNEARVVRALGYVDAGIAAYVYVERAPGRVPLFRVSRIWGAGPDSEHRFAITDAELERLRSEGWSYDGAKGFVCPP